MYQKPGHIAKRIMFGLAIVIAISAGWWIAKRASEVPPLEMTKTEEASVSLVKRAVYLYFGDAPGRYLVAEKRVLARQTDEVDLGRRLIEALIDGPEDEGSRTLPANAILRSFFLNTAGTAFVDFEAGTFAMHPGSVGTELLSIYSIVNTLVLNVDGIRSVKFLIGGQEAATLIGHTDLKEPFEVDMLWVR